MTFSHINFNDFHSNFCRLSDAFEQATCWAKQRPTASSTPMQPTLRSSKKVCSKKSKNATNWKSSRCVVDWFCFALEGEADERDACESKQRNRQTARDKNSGARTIKQKTGRQVQRTKQRLAFLYLHLVLVWLMSFAFTLVY